jgi:hypothetical protein
MKSCTIEARFGKTMSMIQSWISEAVTTLQFQLVRLPSEESREVLRQLRQKYADSASELPLWETISESESRKRVDGWMDVCEYVGDSPCLLVTEKDGPDAYRISSGRDLCRLLSECPGFEFYVTNDVYDYLLCHNHHDYLIGAGQSAEWVATKNTERK